MLETSAARPGSSESCAAAFPATLPLVRIQSLPMRLTDRTLEELSKMVVGDALHFPYRSSYYITKFFERCGLSFKHDGTTRPRWTADRLRELNVGAARSSDLPSDDLCRVISDRRTFHRGSPRSFPTRSCSTPRQERKPTTGKTISTTRSPSSCAMPLKSTTTHSSRL